MTRLIATATLISAAIARAACEDGACELPGAADATPSAVPSCAIAPVKQGPRLTSMDGKTFAIVGGSFMASVTHPELKRLILAEFPRSRVLLLDEIGSAGPYPRPGVVRREKDEFQRRLREMKVDAVISGNGGCGLCTPKETGSCIAAEMLGIPSVMIAGPGFVTQAKSAARSAGIEMLRVAEYPGAFASHSREELAGNTRKILWPQIKEALTKPLSREDVYSPDGDFASDGLPVVPLTDGAIGEFLLFTDRDPDDSLGAIPPAMREVKVRHVAALGVMSGCPAEFMPLLVAFTEAMKDGDFRRTLASTHAWTPYCWLNGPAARQLGFDAGQGEISHPKNAVLGRFINLAMLNFGGYRIKENRMGTFGYLMPWTLAENEEAAVEAGWKPYHLQRGFNMNDSTLSAASAINWGNNLAPSTSDAGRIKDMMAWDAVEKQQMAVGSGMPCVYRTFLITPDVARNLAAAYGSKDALEAALVETARNPLGSRAFANYWGNPGSSFNQERCTLRQHARRISGSENAEATATPPWLEWTGIGEMETVPAMQDGKSAFLVTGDPARNKEMCVPGGAPVTVKIELPRAWDRLMKERGYKPLSSFFIKTSMTPDTPKPRVRGYTRPGIRGDTPAAGRRRRTRQHRQFP
ncbi:MAG: hypothetical protein K6F50_10245 [Kiritimatiellae bacterium]|nr:hypothetical protein [Kiritimatiellia bacterium]